MLPPPILGSPLPGRGQGASPLLPCCRGRRCPGSPAKTNLVLHLRRHRLPAGRAVLSLAVAPADPRKRPTSPVERVVLLIYRVLVAGGLAEEPDGKLPFACTDLSARSLQRVYLSERHTQPSPAALPNAVWRLGNEGQMFGRRK